MSGLRERVARELADFDGALCFDDRHFGGLPRLLDYVGCETYRRKADAIIPLILAEAAKVAREKGATWNPDYAEAAEEIAAAIEGLA